MSCLQPDYCDRFGKPSPSSDIHSSIHSFYYCGREPLPPCPVEPCCRAWADSEGLFFLTPRPKGKLRRRLTHTLAQSLSLGAGPTTALASEPAGPFPELLTPTGPGLPALSFRPWLLRGIQELFLVTTARMQQGHAHHHAATAFECPS